MSASKSSVKRTPKRQLDEATEAKRKREADVFKSFFTKTEKPVVAQQTLQAMDNPRFQPFVIKANWTMAPILIRKPLMEEDRVLLDNSLKNQNDVTNYLTTNKRKSKKLVCASNIRKDKAKYFHFHDNYRPPYYGTWQWKSKEVSGRKPFSTAEKRIQYDYDSDMEWEQEPSDAEECRSEDEEMEKDDSEIEEDDGFFVDHGYLSADEGSEETPSEKPGSNKQTLSSPAPVGETEEQRKKRLAQRAQEWEEGQKQKERRLKEKRVIPNVYLPSADLDPSEHRPQRRYALAGVIFDYSKLVVSQQPNQVLQTPKTSVSKKSVVASTPIKKD